MTRMKAPKVPVMASTTNLLRVLLPMAGAAQERPYEYSWGHEYRGFLGRGPGEVADAAQRDVKS